MLDIGAGTGANLPYFASLSDRIADAVLLDPNAGMLDWAHRKAGQLGLRVEVGDVEKVIREPEHPYTRLLVSSVPLPDPKLRGGQRRLRLTGDELAPVSGGGCRFAPRCPHVIPKCRESTPPLFKTAERRATACYLYESARSVSPTDMASAIS